MNGPDPFFARCVVAALPNGRARVTERRSGLSGLFSPETGELTGDIRHVVRVETTAPGQYLLRIKTGR